MLRALKRLLTLCTAEDIRRLWALLAVVVLTGLLEVAGIASILPFLQLAADPVAALESPWLARVHAALGFESPRAMLFAAGWAVIVFLGLSNLLMALGAWQRQRLAWTIAHHVSMSLARAYVRLPYRFFLERDSGDIVKSVIEDVNGLVDGVVVAGCQLLSQLIVGGMIVALLVLADPPVALAAIGVFVGTYLAMFALRRAWLTELGRRRLAANSARYITFVDLIGGIKAIKSTGTGEHFVARFETPSATFSRIQPKIHFSTVAPRYVVETLAFGAVVAVVLWLTRQGGDFTDVLPMLTLFSLAGYRLMPAANTAYVSAAQLASSYPAIDHIHRDVNLDREGVGHDRAGGGSDADGGEREADEPLAFEREIVLDGISFAYADDEEPVLDAVSLRIPRGSRVAFVGPSGSGKTTLVDVLTGLLEPARGALLVDGVAVDGARRAAWRRQIGYVPQEVFLYNESVARNVAFGAVEVDMARVRESCRLARIDDFVERELDKGYATRIGERGVRLSGGQRQRIGLARALYRQPPLLVLDEATSALDSVTEGDVVAAILDGLPGVTIVMIAHRLSTVRRCGRLHVFDRGRLVAEGGYADLLTGSRLFRELASVD